MDFRTSRSVPLSTTIGRVKLLPRFRFSVWQWHSHPSPNFVPVMRAALWFSEAGTMAVVVGTGGPHDNAGTGCQPAVLFRPLALYTFRPQHAASDLVNLLADMGIQPSTLQAGVVPATASTNCSPRSAILSPASGSNVTPFVVTLSGRRLT